MFTSLSILVSLRQAEVDQVNCRFFCGYSHQKVVRLHIPVDEVVRVHVLQTRYHLVGEHANCLQCKFATTVLEQIFKGVSQEFHDHGFVVSFNAIPEHIRDALYTKKAINK